MPLRSYQIVPDGEVRHRRGPTMTTTEPPAATQSPLHQHLTASMHQLLDILDQHPELAAIHVCTDTDGSIRVLVKGNGVPEQDRRHSVDVLAEAFQLPHAQPTPVAYAAQAGNSTVWTVTRTETVS